MLIMGALGVSFGVMGAVHRNQPIDVAVLISSLIGIAAPSFWLGLLLLWLFSGLLGWFPLTGAGQPGDSLSILHHLVLPALVLGGGGAGIIMRMTRSALLETLSEDYVRTARSKGLHERVVIYRHALRNALIPVITIAGLNMGHLLAGAILVETVFTRPGLGRVVIQSISSRDYPLLQAVIAVYAVIFIAINLFVDIAYTLVDPRIRYG
jgi:ABC-type dipeptide/oligopeptide/nickel transport system permease component